jgi:hypothetical protein
VVKEFKFITMGINTKGNLKTTSMMGKEFKHLEVQYILEHFRMERNI